MARRFQRNEERCPECGYSLAKNQWECPVCGWSVDDYQIQDSEFDSWEDDSDYSRIPRIEEDRDSLFDP